MTADAAAIPGQHAVGSEGLRALRRARRDARRAHIDWIDALYRVYLSGLAGVGAIVAITTALPDDPLGPTAVEQVLADAPGWLGLALAAALWMALRSGSRGGPLALEPAVVAHELLAPVDRGAALRAPAARLLRFWVFTGTCLGALAGLSVRLLPTSLPAAIAAGAAVGALAALATASCALNASGYRWSARRANLVGLALMTWAGADLASSTVTSPMSAVGSVALWPVAGAADPLTSATSAATSMAALLIIAALCISALRGIGGLSVESAMRRAGLVSQLRFAVTLQDVRTVVLLRRSLAQEQPRAVPRFGVPSWGWLPPTVRRDLRGMARFPITRWAQLLGLGIIAGLAMGGVWNGVPALIVVAAAALHVASFDATEALAQEVDHPTRWAALRGPGGTLLLWHLPVAATSMMVVCIIASLAALVLVPSEVVLALAPAMVVPAAGAAAVSGGVSAAAGAPDMAKLSMLGPDLMGAAMLARMVLPFLLVLAALVPALFVGSDPDALNTMRLSNLLAYSLFAVGFGLLYLRAQEPARS